MPCIRGTKIVASVVATRLCRDRKENGARCDTGVAPTHGGVLELDECDERDVCHDPRKEAPVAERKLPYLKGSSRTRKEVLGCFKDVLRMF